MSVIAFIIVPLVILALTAIAAVMVLGINNMETLGKCLGPTAGIIIVGSAIGYGVGTANMRHREFINYRVMSVEHQEKWTTEESYTVTIHDGYDKDGNEKTHTETRYRTDTHGPYWYANDELGGAESIDESEYEQWKKLWGNEAKTGEHKGSAAGFDRAITGGIFESRWNHEFDTIYPSHHIGTYINKIRASKYSSFKFQQPTQQLIERYPRPADHNDPRPILNYGASISITEADQMSLMRTNANLGCGYQVHNLFLLFDGSKTTPSVVDEVLSAWQGPNKNELVVFMGIDPTTKKATWVKVESWMDNTKIHGTLADAFLGKEFSGKMASEILGRVVPLEWKRKRFRDFDYIRIELSSDGYVTAGVFWFLAILWTVGSIIYLRHEDRDYDRPFHSYFNRRSVY